MIGIIRVRLSTAPAAAVWSDQQWQTLMDPTVVFSLGHYWRRCSFNTVDLNYRLFPPVTVTDPQPTMTPEQIKADSQFRSTRVSAITKAVDDQFKPDWKAFSTLLIWVASPLDLFGSSAFDHGQGRSALMMCDMASRFDQLCHELGHTLGFDHPIGRDGVEYNSDYDIMGDYDSSWTRAGVAALPVGAAADGSDPMVLVGPMISAAQLSTSRRPQLGSLFVDLPPEVRAAPQTVKLTALDRAASLWPQVDGPAGVVLPPDPISPDHHYVLELRRSNDYDGGLRSPARPSNPVEGVVVHGYNAATKRFHFAGVLPLTSNVGDTDLHVFSGAAGADITLRLLEVGPNDEWARVRVGGPNYWRNFGVDVDPRQTQTPPQLSEWRSVTVKPCVFAPLAVHQYRLRTVSQRFDIVATSFGYEAPLYTWRLNGVVLQAGTALVELNVQTSVPDPNLGRQRRGQTIRMQCTVTGSTLNLVGPSGDPATIGTFHLPLEVTVNETSPEVIKSNYPDQSVRRRSPTRSRASSGTDAYGDALDECERMIKDVDRKRIPIPKLQVPQRADDDLPNLLDVLGSIIDANPAAANAVIDEVSRSAGISRIEVLRRLQQHR